MKTYIVGHKNPDTDSVVSAIIFCNLEPTPKDYVPAVAGPINKETEYVLKRFGFETPEIIQAEEKKVILVDHNEPAQMASEIRPEEIIGIFDHHKLGGLSTAEPIRVSVEPYGCTASLAHDIFEKNNLVPDERISSLMLAAIISDTLNLTSPTTTEKDKKVYEAIVGRTGINTDELASAMFAAKSDITDIPTEELLTKDYKVYNLGGKQVGIGVWETTLAQTVLERKAEILKELAAAKEKENLDAIYFGVIDILKGKTDLIILGESESALAEKAFGLKVNEGIVELPGVVSRKKQLAPQLQEAING